jgi:hypothetical protein
LLPCGGTAKPATCLCYGSDFLSCRRKFLRRIAARSEFK